MKKELRDKLYGTTVDEQITQVPEELEIDAVGLWQIVPFGRQGFDLSGDELDNYVRRHILALLAKGAKPVVGATDGIHYWTPVDYGRTPNEIADAVIAEWHALGRDPNPGDVWFALPEIYEATLPESDRKTSKRRGS